MSMSYAQLTEAIQRYTEVDESSFVDNIPNFIQNTETLVNNSVQLPAFRKNVTGETTIDFPYIDIPNDFLSIFSIAVTGYDTAGVLTPTDYTYLLQKDVNYIREAYPFPGSSGVPKAYSLFSNNAFLLGPTPDKCYTLEMHYYAYPTSITVAGVSWLGTNFPNVLLWGSLVEASIYLKEAEMMQGYQAKFDEAMSLLRVLGDGKDRIDTYRTMQTRNLPIP
jgi:hypothetical protein